MSVFSLQEASYFCNWTTGSPVPDGSFRQWSTMLPNGSTLTEGTSEFDRHRQLANRECDRLLFLAASHYRRAFDMQVSSGAPWAHVTLYYGAYYAAHSILGMFGAWAIKNSSAVVQVLNGTPSQQQLKVLKNPSAAQGSHQRFWAHFYATAAQLLPMVDVSHRFALQPVGGDSNWLTTTRNDVNYDTHSAVGLIASHKQQFRRSKLRTSLPGVLSTQFSVSESLLAVATQFARELELSSTAMVRLQATGGRRELVRTMISLVPAPAPSRFLRRRWMT
jgi:hypothetical protein